MPPIIAGLITAGGAIGGGLIARNGAKNIADQQQQQAQYLQTLTKPAFDQSYGYYSGLLSNDPSKVMQSVGPDINNTNQLFGNAQRNLLGSATARGGGLTAGLANLEGQRAATMSSIIGTARQGAAANLGNLASGQQTQALGALAGAQTSNFQNTILQSQAMGGIGSFLTRMFSGINYGGGNNNSFSNPVVNPIVNPSALIPNTSGSTSQFFNPYGTPNPDTSNQYFPQFGSY